MFFDNFPKIEYNGKQVVNILARVRLNEHVRQQTSAFLPYTLEYNQKPTDLSYDYYDDPQFDWLVLLANNIVDPYFGWYINDVVFQEFIADKYGSYVAAVEQVDHYNRNTSGSTDPYDDIRVNTDTYTIAPDAVEYAAKTAYDQEIDNNNDRRLVSLVNKEIRFKAVEDLERLLNARQK